MIGFMFKTLHLTELLLLAVCDCLIHRKTRILNVRFTVNSGQLACLVYVPFSLNPVILQAFKVDIDRAAKSPPLTDQQQPGRRPCNLSQKDALIETVPQFFHQTIVKLSQNFRRTFGELSENFRSLADLPHMVFLVMLGTPCARRCYNLENLL
jgi:hypothetical protein